MQIDRTKQTSLKLLRIKESREKKERESEREREGGREGERERERECTRERGRVGEGGGGAEEMEFGGQLPHNYCFSFCRRTSLHPTSSPW